MGGFPFIYQPRQFGRRHWKRRKDKNEIVLPGKKRKKRNQTRMRPWRRRKKIPRNKIVDV